MKKKLIRLFLSGLICTALCAGFAGCGSTENSDQDFGDEEYDVEIPIEEIPNIKSLKDFYKYIEA